MNKHKQRKLRHARVRAKVIGSSQKPRLNIFRSNSYIFAQLIDDSTQKTVAAVSTKVISNLSSEKSQKIDASYQAGQNLAKKALDLKIKNIVFDRSGYKYHGRIKALAEGAKEGGLIF